ncbi:MAG: hypothetical protein BZ137_00085 [Methanosphaera sp. rholeuAM130]|nr:mechanosensitive ion channel [Methanosphaera sp.]RAP54844.1 MAG: hypothetical protein BZ137_00085 [Methanosphaera sp. rholeuAM130]
MISQPFDLIIPYLSTIIQIAIAVLIPVLIMKIIVRALLKYDDADNFEKTPIRRLVSIVHYITIIFIFVAILSILGIDLQSLILSLGLASVVISLAAKDTISNIISGIIIIVEKKFKVGDLIEIDGQLGKVKRIGLKSVELTYKTRYISIPNVVFSTKPFINYTRFGVFPESFQINLRNDYDLEEKIGELEKILDNNDLILKEPKYLILPKNITPYGVDVTVKFFITDPIQNNKIKAQLIREIKRKMIIENIE